MPERLNPNDDLSSTIAQHSRVRYELAARYVAGKDVLDIACGTGVGSTFLADTARSVTGADVSGDAIEAARTAFVRPNIRYVHAPGPSLPFEDGQFDVVVSLETIEHVREDQQAAFVRELSRVLRPDGVLLLSTPDRDAERRHELATGVANPWHVHTPSHDCLDALLDGFPNRLVLQHVDLSATAVVPERDAAPASAFIARTQVAVTSPIAIVYVCARDAEALPSVASDHPALLFRREERLATVDATLDALPVRLRWTNEGTEQARRIEAVLDPDAPPGTTMWWHRRAVYMFAAVLARGRRALDIDTRSGSGAALLATTAASVVATVRPAPTAGVPGALHDRPLLAFIETEALLPDAGEFDVVVCLSDRTRNADAVIDSAFQRLTANGLLFADRPAASAVSMRLMVTDCVATAILPALNVVDCGGYDVASAVPVPTTFRSFFVSARSAEALQAARSLGPLVVLRGDFQREALATQLYHAATVHDLSGFDADERHDMLALRLDRLDRSLETEARTLQQAIVQLNAGLAIALTHRPLLSLRSALRRVRDLFIRNSETHA